MKQYAKLYSGCCLLFFTFFTLLADAALGPVTFNLRLEEITTEAGQQGRRAYFNIRKGGDTLPVCLSSTVQYDTEIFEPVKEEDIKPCKDHDTCSNIDDKDISLRFDPNLPGIIGIMVGVEEYNDLEIKDGDLLHIDFILKPGASPGEDSIRFCVDPNIGPNQASNSAANLLPVNMNIGKDGGVLYADDNRKVKHCFIDALP